MKKVMSVIILLGCWIGGARDLEKGHIAPERSNIEQTKDAIDAFPDTEIHRIADLSPEALSLKRAEAAAYIYIIDALSERSQASSDEIKALAKNSIEASTPMIQEDQPGNMMLGVRPKPLTAPCAGCGKHEPKSYLLSHNNLCWSCYGKAYPRN